MSTDDARESIHMLLLALAFCLSCASGCGAVATVLNPEKLPLDAYLICDFTEPVDSGVTLKCGGTFADPICSTDAGIGVHCVTGVSTFAPIIGHVGTSAELSAGVEPRIRSSEVTACVFAGPMNRCVTAESP